MTPEQQSVSPDVDNFRIQAIRARIAEEDYIVNPRQIADKIIDMEKALFCCNHQPS
jgi:anti-sigma28 factor (negative regulator of flagellin synthesis)